MTIGGNLRLEISGIGNGDIGTGGNITLSSGGTLSVSGDATFRLFNGAEVTINSSPTFDIRAESLFVGGFLDALIQNFDGSIVGNAGIKLTLSGSLIAQRGASFGIVSDVEFVGPLSIVGNAGIDVVAGSFAGLSLSAFINTPNGGSIGGFAAINIVASGEVNIGSDASFLIVNDTNTDSGEGGTIGSNAEINVHAGSFSADSLQASISNGGSVGQDAIVNFGTVGDISAQGDAVFQILNSAQDAGNGSGSNAGIIGGNALLDVSATNISSGGLLQVTIDNHGNGMIGGDATINLNAASVGAGSLEAFLFDYDGADIGGNALINFVVAGDISVQGSARFAIDSASQGGAGTIASNATIAANIGSLNAGSLSAYIVNYGSEIGDNATISFGASGDITAGSSAIFEIFNNGLEGTGGIIGSNATISVTGASISTNNFFAAIFNNHRWQHWRERRDQRERGEHYTRPRYLR